MAIRRKADPCMFRAFDLAMLEIHNARERSYDDWAGLFSMADERFRFQGIEKPSKSNLSIIVASWNG